MVTTSRICCGLGVIAVGLASANADLMIQGSATDNLAGPVLFIDDAVTGGSDVTVNEPDVGSYARSFDLDGNGAIGAPGIGGTVVISGFAFATSASALANDATNLTISVTYLGVDGTGGGGDDVLIGTRDVAYTHAGAGEYYVNFDSLLSASIDGQGDRFRISVTPSNGTGDGSVRFKSGPQAFEPVNGVKLSVSGSFTAIPEPSALALVGVAGLGLMLFRRR